MELRDVAANRGRVVGPGGAVGARADDHFDAAAEGARHSEVFHEALLARGTGGGMAAGRGVCSPRPKPAAPIVPRQTEAPRRSRRRCRPRPPMAIAQPGAVDRSAAVAPTPRGWGMAGSAGCGVTVRSAARRTMPVVECPSTSGIRTSRPPAPSTAARPTT